MIDGSNYSFDNTLMHASSLQMAHNKVVCMRTVPAQHIFIKSCVCYVIQKRKISITQLNLK